LPSARQQAQETKRQLRAKRFERVRRLRKEGQSLLQIARAIGLSTKCVICYLRTEHCLDWSRGQPRPTQLDVYATQVEEWLARGGRNAAVLYRNLGGPRLPGWLRRRPAVSQPSPGQYRSPGPRTGDTKPAPPAPPSARKLSFAFIRRAEDREEEEQAPLEKLRDADSGCVRR